MNASSPSGAGRSRRRARAGRRTRDGGQAHRDQEAQHEHRPGAVGGLGLRAAPRMSPRSSSAARPARPRIRSGRKAAPGREADRGRPVRGPRRGCGGSWQGRGSSARPRSRPPGPPRGGSRAPPSGWTGSPPGRARPAPCGRGRHPRVPPERSLRGAKCQLMRDQDRRDALPVPAGAAVHLGDELGDLREIRSARSRAIRSGVESSSAAATA